MTGSGASVLLVDGSGVLIDVAVAGIFVCVGSEVLVDGLVLTTTGVTVGRGVNHTDSSTLSTGVSATYGVQDANTKVMTKPRIIKHIVVLISQRNYTPAASVSRSMAFGDKRRYDERPLKDNGRLVFSSGRIAVCGPSAIDILVGDDSVDEALLLNVDSPLLIIGLVGGAAQSYNLEMTIGFENGSKVSLVAGDLVMTGPVPAAGTEAVVTIGKTVDKTPTKSVTTRRILVGEEIWHEAHVLAARTYVPSTEASHARGAGAGMLDND